MRVAIAVIGFFGVLTPASAQSVLERVLNQVDGMSNIAPLNGVYANIAESTSRTRIVPAIAATTAEQIDPAVPGTTLEQPWWELSNWITVAALNLLICWFRTLAWHRPTLA